MMWESPPPEPEAPSILAVLGPTASGKTDIAIQLAENLGGEILSCDSVQIYKELNIGSAKPTPEELARIPHYMINSYSPDFQIDVGRYKKDAEAAIQTILKKGKIPILCGGTGMYFNSLYYGLTDAPGRDDSIRIDLENRAETNGIESLYSELNSCDPDSAAKIMPNDLRRIIRALEVFKITQIPLSKHQSQNKRFSLNWLPVVLSPERSLLYSRIESRVDKMFEKGLLEETRQLVNKYGKDAYALGCIGYRHCIQVLDGRWDMETAVSELKKDTRHYAKRQLTWFKKIAEARWFDSTDKASIFQSAGNFLGEKE